MLIVSGPDLTVGGELNKLASNIAMGPVRHLPIAPGLPGHATVAGACVTILKALFDCREPRTGLAAVLHIEPVLIVSQVANPRQDCAHPLVNRLHPEGDREP